MSISLYSGLTGTGKSYGVVANIIIPALEQKRKIFTNIPMNLELCNQELGYAPILFDAQDIIDNKNWFDEVFEDGAMFICDEVWRLWGQGLTSVKANTAHTTFLAEHRHLVGDEGCSTEIILLTQDAIQLATFVHALIDNTFRSNKLSNLGADKRYRVDIYDGCVKGKYYPDKAERQDHGSFKPEIYKFYKSHTKSKTGAAGDETRMDNRFRGFGTKVKLGFLLFFFLLVFIFYNIKTVGKKFGFFQEPVIQEKNLVQNKLASQTQVQNKVASQQVQTQKESNSEEFKFLSDADEFFISANIGHFPYLEFQFTVVISESQSQLTIKQLESMDYKVEPINECLVKVKGDDFNGVIMCKQFKVENNKDGWVSNISKPSPVNNK